MKPAPVMLWCRDLTGGGGSERQLMEVAKALDRSRFAPQVGCFHLGDTALQDLRQHQVPVHQFQLTSLKSPRALAAAWNIFRHLRRERIALAHAFDYPSSCIILPIAHYAGVPVVLDSQRGSPKLTPSNYRRWQVWADTKAQGIVTNSAALQQELADEYHVPARKLRVCPNGMHAARFHTNARPVPSSQRPAALANASLVIGCIAMWRPEKDLLTLINAFAQVSPLHPGLKLVLVGAGPVEANLRERVRELSLTESVVLQPFTPDPAPWHAAIDIFVLPSLSEAMSNSLMEAMASGAAVIASAVGGNRELVTPEVNGLLFPAGDKQALAACLTRLIDDPELRARLGSAAAKLLQEQYSIEAMAERMGAIYDEFLAGG